MTNWKNKLRKELKKQFSKDEIEEIIAYYEEIINDRVDRGEDLDKVLRSYNPHMIKKEMLPTMIQKRDHTKVKSSGRSSGQILLILFSTPILLPLLIIYLALIIVACALVITGFAVMVASLLALIPYSIDIFTTTTNQATQFGLLGIGLVILPVASLIGYGLFKTAFVIMKSMISFFSKLITRKQA